MNAQMQIEAFSLASVRSTDRLDGLSREYFDKGWREEAEIKPCSVAELDGFVMAHYLQKRPAVVVLCLKMLVRSIPVGMVIYAMPPREAETRYGGKTWELARLYLLDEVPKNGETWLIARSVRWIKQHHREVRYLVSYADPTAGHRGTIYQAANWKADGRTDEGRKTARCDYYDERTGKKYGRKGNMPANAIVSRKPRVSKWRYVLAV
jgi:hypothetical protein